MTQAATPGRIVHYVLSEADAQQINRRRADFEAFRRNHVGEHESGTFGASGHVAHVGNQASEGDLYPAIVVRTFGGPSVNLQVFLDGNDTYWATSRSETDADKRESGKWFWPARA